jgi:hypothetical protein
MTQYYIQPGKPKHLKSVPLAFTVPDDLDTVPITGLKIAWTKSALREFSEIQKASSAIKELPYASLRGLLQVGLTNAARIEPHVGLQTSILSYAQKSKDAPKPFTYLTDTDEASIQKVLRRIWNNWRTNYLLPFVRKEDIPEELLDRLDDLQEQGQLLTISPFSSEVLPWDWNQETGTTQPKDRYGYHSLVDYVVRLIAGREIFAGLGAMKRIVSSYGGLTSNQAELITDPISISDLGKFSLVVKIEVVTFPSLHQPLLTIDVSKRRWITKLKDPKYDRSNINGFVFCENYSDRVFNFRVICRKNEQKKWVWKNDQDFEALRRELQLPMQPFSGSEISLNQADTDACKFVLTHRNGLEKHKIGVGVPEIDKLEVFEAIAKIIEPFGIVPFQAYTPFKNKNKGATKETSKEINLPTLIGSILEKSETKCEDFTQNYLEQLNDLELDAALKDHFDFALQEIKRERKAFKVKSQIKELTILIQENKNALQRLYPNQPLSLLIFYEQEAHTEAKLLTKIAQLLWGESLDILSNRLPADTHGPKDTLPGHKLSAKERSQLRIEQWESITQQLKDRDSRTFCLVMAREWYQTGEKDFKHDDRINKPSTRQALATMAGSCVQFIVPMSKTKLNQIDLEDFSRRVQKSLQELLSAHSGRIDDVKTKVEKCLTSIEPDARPKEIISITIVRKQKGRCRGRIENTFLPIAVRLNLETGRCEMCCAYEKGDRLQISPWSFFPDAIAFISQISPVKLAHKREKQKTRFMEFVNKIISPSVQEGKQPLVIIDSSNCVKLWRWLADTTINANQIDLGQQYQDMQQAWKGARLIRVRQDLAPGIIDKKERHLFETCLEDTRSKQELKQLDPDIRIPSASSSTGLFKLNANNSTGCVAYLSVGGKTLHQNLRGLSCYHPTKINTSAKVNNKNAADMKIYQLTEKAEFTERWPSPNPLEIVVTLRQPDDNPDELAALVESLRYGFGHYAESTALPAPLFFERVVRDYISEFAINDNEPEDDPEEEEPEGKQLSLFE